MGAFGLQRARAARADVDFGCRSAAPDGLPGPRPHRAVVSGACKGLAAARGRMRSRSALARARTRSRHAAPPVVVRDELQTGSWSSHCRIPEVAETFYATVLKRRFPHRLLAERLPVAKPTTTAPASR